MLMEIQIFEKLFISVSYNIYIINKKKIISDLSISEACFKYY